MKYGQKGLLDPRSGIKHFKTVQQAVFKLIQKEEKDKRKKSNVNNYLAFLRAFLSSNFKTLETIRSYNLSWYITTFHT